MNIYIRFSCSFISDLNIEDEEKADFDAFIDEILELVGPALTKAEIVLPDFEEEFEQGLLFVTLHGSAKVYYDLNPKLPIEFSYIDIPQLFRFVSCHQF